MITNKSSSFVLLSDIQSQVFFPFKRLYPHLQFYEDLSKRVRKEGERETLEKKEKKEEKL